MSLLYQVDFRALPSQLSLTPGAHTIDGLPWWFKGSLTPGGGRTFSCSLINGTGLRIAYVAGTPGGIGSNADLDEPHWFLPLSALAGWLPGQALLVRTRTRRTSGGSSIVPMTGLVDTTSDAVGLRAAQRVKDHLIGPDFTVGGTFGLTVKWGSAGPVGGRFSRTSAIPNNECAVGILNNQIAGWATHGSEHLIATLPTSIGSYLPGSGSPISASGDPYFQWTSRSNPGFLFGFETQFSTWTVDLEFLRIDVIGEIDDTLPPTVELLSPPVTQRVGRKTPIVLRVTDESSLSRNYLWAEYDYGSEVIYAGDRFLPAFAAESLVSGTNPRTFTIIRTGGWLGNPTVYVEPIDRGGNTSS